jgi:hypothetical protein
MKINNMNNTLIYQTICHSFVLWSVCCGGYKVDVLSLDVPWKFVSDNSTAVNYSLYNNKWFDHSRFAAHRIHFTEKTCRARCFTTWTRGASSHSFIITGSWRVMWWRLSDSSICPPGWVRQNWTCCPAYDVTAKKHLVCAEDKTQLPAQGIAHTCKMFTI